MEMEMVIVFKDYDRKGFLSTAYAYWINKDGRSYYHRDGLGYWKREDIPDWMFKCDKATVYFIEDWPEYNSKLSIVENCTTKIDIEVPMLLAEMSSDNWIGRGCKKGADFINRMLQS